MSGREFTLAAGRRLKASGLEAADVREMVERLLVRPSDSVWWDKRLFEGGWCIAFGRPAWSLTTDYALTEVNAWCAWERLKGMGAELSGYGSWTYANFECIMVPLVSVEGCITSSAVELAVMNAELNQYTFLEDMEDRYFELNNALEMWEFYDATAGWTDADRGRYWSWLMWSGFGVDNSYAFAVEADWKEFDGEWEDMAHVDVPLGDARYLMYHGYRY